MTKIPKKLMTEVTNVFYSDETLHIKLIPGSAEGRGLNSTYLAVATQVAAEKIIKTMHLAPPLYLKILIKAP